MIADLALVDDGLTVEFESADECPDLTAGEAEAVTSRIRQWVHDFPIADVVLAFRGRVWVALAYASWAEWCECELGGLKLPAPKRREVVAELAGEGMSNVTIADALNVTDMTVHRDLAASTNVDPERARLGQDGKNYTPPQPRPSAPQPEPEIVDAEIVCRDCDGFGCETCVPVDDAAQEDWEPDPTLEPAPTPKPTAPQSPTAPRRTSIIDTARQLAARIAEALDVPVTVLFEARKSTSDITSGNSKGTAA